MAEDKLKDLENFMKDLKSNILTKIGSQKTEFDKTVKEIKKIKNIWTGLDIQLLLLKMVMVRLRNQKIKQDTTPCGEEKKVEIKKIKQKKREKNTQRKKENIIKSNY